jgi:hypothetical protein
MVSQGLSVKISRTAVHPVIDGVGIPDENGPAEERLPENRHASFADLPPPVVSSSGCQTQPRTGSWVGTQSGDQLIRNIGLPPSYRNNTAASTGNTI